MSTVVWALVVLGSLGLVFGVLLAVAGKVFAVEKDPKEAAVRAAVAGANCGACGYPGCDGYAAAVVRGEAPVNGCVPGGQASAEKIAGIMGVQASASERYVAFVRCSGTAGHTKQKFTYEGLPTCLAASRLGGGSGSNVCTAGCMGCGDCVAACQFDAMHIVNGIAKVNRKKCVACMKCAEACPKKLIVKVPYDTTDIVACNSTEKGAAVRKFCDFGCIGCGLCKKECPADAITVENNLAVIDQSKCIHCGHCSDICPRHIILDRR
jgi:electron transport complex protein RnfB